MRFKLRTHPDVLIAGGGNAALCAVFAAAEGGTGCWCWRPRRG